MKRLKFLETKRKPRYSMRKLNVGMASVLLGVTIFGINFTNHSVKAATTNSNSQQTKGINAIGAVNVPDSQNDANKAIDDALNNKKSEINGATNIDQTTKDKLNQAATDAADKAKEATTNNDVATEQTNTQKAASATGKVQQSSASNNATANNSTEAATTLQSAPKTQGSAGSGASGSSATGVVSRSQDSNSQAASAAGAPASSDQTVTVDETTLPATQAAMLFTNLARLKNSGTDTTLPATQAAMLFTNLARLTNSETDTPLPPTTQTYDKVEQPLLYDYGLHVDVKGTRDGRTWVDKTLGTGIKDYRGNTLDTIFGKTSKPGIITSNPGKYFFAAYVDFSEPYHRVILLARSQDPSDKNLYSYTIHTYRQKTSTTTIKPGDSTKEQYSGVSGFGGSKHDLIFQNYDGDSFSVKLNGFKEGQEYGLLPVFDGGLLDPTYGSNTYDQNNKAAETKSIGFWASAIPQKTSTEVRYVDQATGKDIVQPMEISGFGYQGFKVNGEAPTVKGYHLVSSPEFLPSTNKASAYEDGTISPYEVGQTYDLALSDSVVIKQTVIDTNGTVRATAYYKGSRLPSTDASKVLGRESNNDYMSFSAPDGKFYAYTNRIGQVDGSYIYYYAKNSDPKGSDMRLHFIDVTGVNNSSYAPSDGPELDADKKTIHGNIGENYSFTYTVPKGYDRVGTSDVTGTYSGTHHDAYVYVKIDRNGAKATIEKLTHLNHAQKQAAEAAIDQATDLNTMNQATSTATTLDGDMGKLSDLTADLTNTNNYKYASDKPKSTVAADYTNADVLLDKDDKTAGQNADDATVLKLIDQINTHKSSLDGDTNLSAAETTISGLTHLNDAQRSAANQAVTNASDLTGLKTAVGNAQSVDSAMSDLQTAVNQANEAKKSASYYNDANGDDKSALDKALSKAATDLNNKALTQATANQDAQAIEDAINGLKGQPTNLEKLNQAISAGTSAQAGSKYANSSAESKGALDGAIKAGQTAKTQSGLTQKEADADASAIETAIKGLSGKETDKTALNEAINKGHKTQTGSSDYQDTSDAKRSQLDKDITDAETLNQDPKASQSNVDAAAKKISDDINNLNQGTDATKNKPVIPASKIPVGDHSHLTDSEKDQVKKKLEDANKGKFPDGTKVDVGDDGTTTVTYPDGSKNTIPGRDLIIGVKGEDISGNKHDSNSPSGSNTDDETNGNNVNNAEGMNGNTAKSGSKNNSLKTLPQTGTKDVTILEILGLFLSLFGLLGLKKKHREE